ncbi:MAG: hypothetical protein IPO22_02425 [Anaerolineales bacterium]|nr:hypothetical protein [Anaerolineales bacterium]
MPEGPTTLNYFLADATIVRQVADSTSMTGLATISEDSESLPALSGIAHAREWRAFGRLPDRDVKLREGLEMVGRRSANALMMCASRSRFYQPRFRRAGWNKRV